MSNGKARRVDFSPDEYIAGVGGVLRADEQGVYWMICSLIMSEGDAIEQNDRRLAALCLMRPSDMKRIVESLVGKGKILRQSDGKLAQKRAQSEVERSLNRIQTASENGSKGGRPGGKGKEKQQKPKPDGSFPEKLTTNYQLPTINHQPIEEESKDPSSVADIFDQFWSAYPKRSDRKMAEKAFAKAAKRAPADTIVAGARVYGRQRADQDQKYTKNPATWLNNDCWEEANATSASGGGWQDDPAYAGVE